VLQAEVEVQHSIIDCGTHDRKLRNESILILNLDREIPVWQNILRMIEDAGQFSGDEPVLTIIRHPRLEKTRLHRTPRASAVHEVPRHVPDLRDVKVIRYPPAVGKNEAQWLVCVKGELGKEVRDVHQFEYGVEGKRVAGFSFGEPTISRPAES
jgi:hypothetical protein